jgi:hypothetical protein
MTAFWDIVRCRLVEVDRRFTGAYCLHNQALMTEAVRISETSVNFYEITRRKIPEGCHLHTRRGEKLRSDSNTEEQPVFSSST